MRKKRIIIDERDIKILKFCVVPRDYHKLKQHIKIQKMALYRRLNKLEDILLLKKNDNKRTWRRTNYSHGVLKLYKNIFEGVNL